MGWAETQQCYFTFLRSRRMGKQWLSALILKLWDIAWDMWDHQNKVEHNGDETVLNKQVEEDIQAQFQLGIQTLTDSTKPLFQ